MTEAGLSCTAPLEAGTRADAGFLAVLEQADVSLAVSTHPGALGCFGAEDGRLTACYTLLSSPFGIGYENGRLVVARRREITAYALSRRLAPHYPPRPSCHDALFVPVGSYRTGECNVHDVTVDGRSVVFANTNFSCLSRADGLSSFVPLWRPPFVSALMPEDRCHLNSFALDGRRIRYATAFATTDVPNGYRAAPLDAGVVIDVEANAVAVVGLIKPHSVRLFGGELYVLNSGAGELLRVDLTTRRTELIAELPGFTRGLRALGDVLLVGTSRLRPSARGLGLPVQERGNLRSGIFALDRRDGRLLGELSLPDDVIEVFDFVTIPGVKRARIQDPCGRDLAVGVETAAASFWMRASEPPQL